MPLGEQDRIEEHVFFIRRRLVAGQIEDEHPVGQIDLVGGQADALALYISSNISRTICMQFGIDAAERLRLVAKRRMGITDDAQAGEFQRTKGNGSRSVRLSLTYQTGYTENEGAQRCTNCQT